MKKFNWINQQNWSLPELELEINQLYSPEKTVFHSTTWLKSFGNKHELWSCRDEEGNLVAYFLGCQRSKFSVKGFHIPPFTQCFSPVFADQITEKERQQLLGNLLPLLDQYGVVDFKFPFGHHDILPYYWAGYQIQTYLTYVVSGTYEDYMAKLNKNKVREIKKLQKMVDDGQLIFSEDIEEKEFLSLFAKTANRGAFDYRVSDLVGMYRNRQNYKHKLFGIRSNQHGLLSIGLFPYDGQTVYNIVNASIRINDSVLKTINLLMLHEIIRFALSSGRNFDFEGSMLSGVSDFYRLMGGIQMPVYRAIKSRNWRYSVLRAVSQIKNDRKKA